MDDETINAQLDKLRKLSSERRAVQEDLEAIRAEEDAIATALLATGRWGVKSKVADSLGLTPEAVRLRYGSVHKRMPTK